MKTLKKYEDLIKKCGFITFAVLLCGLCGFRLSAQQPGTVTLNLEETVHLAGNSSAERSEERRVGKECRSRWSPYH